MLVLGPAVNDFDHSEVCGRFYGICLSILAVLIQEFWVIAWNQAEALAIAQNLRVYLVTGTVRTFITSPKDKDVLGLITFQTFFVFAQKDRGGLDILNLKKHAPNMSRLHGKTPWGFQARDVVVCSSVVSPALAIKYTASMSKKARVTLEKDL
jgi:hypothetical protein